MPITLAQAEMMSRDPQLKGIYRELIVSSPLMRTLEFEDNVGMAYPVVREDENNPPSVQVYQPNDTWTESTGQVTKRVYALTTLGGDADVDKFLQKTRSDPFDLMATQVEMKTRAMARKFEELAVYGNDSAGEFPGFHQLVEEAGDSQQVHCGTDTTGGPLTLLKLDEAIDKVTAGTPSFILINKTIARYLIGYLRTVASYQVERDEYGNRVEFYNGIPILTTDFLYQTEAIANGVYSASTGGNTSSIFVGTIGGDGIVGIQNGGIQTEFFEKLETKNAMRTRILWYVSIAQHSTKSLVRIDGIAVAPVTSGLS